MTKFQFFFLTVLSCSSAPSFAGLFSDKEARQQIVELESRLATTEESLAKLQALFQQQGNAYSQQTGAMLDMQTSLEAINADMRKLRGQNEELMHNLQDLEKRQKDLYVDLDGRLRRFEVGDAVTTEKASGKKTKVEDPSVENRALEVAYNFYKIARYQNAVTAFQEFLTNYPQSVHVANIRYWMGNAFFVLKDYKASLENYQQLVNKFNDHPKVVDALFSIADCQELLRDKAAAKQTLKQVMQNYPGTEAALKAKKRFSTIK
jgi:tol-pal system protein YbgF